MSKNPLNIQNPESLTYENQLQKITVLGGIKIEGMDRMRVTLKIEIIEGAVPPVRHSLDLYNDNQLEKFIRKVAERHEIGTSVVSASLSELTSQLENYRLEQKQEQQTEQAFQIAPMSHGEIKEVEDFLKSKDLLLKTNDLLQQAGIIGEQKNRMILYLAMSSRKCEDPLSVVCLAGSGAGKSHLMEKVAECMPIEDLLENTQFTENSFYYFKREEIKHKVFLVEDLDGAEEVLYPIRELQSKKRISKTVTVKGKDGQMRTVRLLVEGPVSVIGCTTKEKIYEDNANRSILIYLDQSKEQDSYVQDHQKRIKAGLINSTRSKEVTDLLTNVQRHLSPVKIINPYAPLINLPQTVFKPRRTMGLLLNFIEAITYYHQGQREEKVNKETGEVYIETTYEDIANAFELLRETLFRKSDELSGVTRDLYEKIKANLAELVNQETETFNTKSIRNKWRIHPRTLQRHLKELVTFGYLEIKTKNKQTNSYEYQLQAESPVLQELLDKHIKELLADIENQAKPASKSRQKKNVASK